MKRLLPAILVLVSMVSCGKPIQILPASLPDGSLGKPYSITLKSVGGQGEISWSLSGTLPGGLEFDSFGPDIHGLPNQEGCFTFTVTARDESIPRKMTTVEYTVTIGKDEDTFVVNGFTDSAIQAACDLAESNNGGVVYLPTGDYVFEGTVEVPSNTTVLGPGRLRNVVERDEVAGVDFPIWIGGRVDCITPSRSDKSDRNLEFFKTTGKNVTFAYLRIIGNAYHESKDKRGSGIYLHNADRAKILNCEIKMHTYGVRVRQSTRVEVADSYIHQNNTEGLGYGVVIMGNSMSTGGATCIVRDSEFAGCRHDIASNSPDTNWALIRCYFRDSDTLQNQPSVDTHAQGGETLQFFVGDCKFGNTRPTSIRTGSGIFLRNRFLASCGDWQPPIIKIGPPHHSASSYVSQADVNNLYLSGNVNQSSNTFLGVPLYEYPDGTTRHVARGVFMGGQGLYCDETTNTVKPMVGEVYLAKVGVNQPVRKIRKGREYDLHAYVLDPQNRYNISEVRIFLVRDGAVDLDRDWMKDAPGYIHPVMAPVRLTRYGQVYTMGASGSNQWFNVTNQVFGNHLLPRSRRVYASGSHRIHFRIRVKLPAGVDVTEKWRIIAVAKDMNGNESVVYDDPYRLLVR